MKKIKYAVFGCTADPFTPAHKAIVDALLVNHTVDKVIISPTIVNWHRAGKDSWLSDDSKIFVIKEFWGGTFPANVILDDSDMKLKQLCRGSETLTERKVKERRFIDTLLDIKIRYGVENEYFTVIGTDSAKEFKTWFAYEEILKLSNIVVVLGRGGKNDADFGFQYIPLYIDEDFANISASKVREQYSKDAGLQGLHSYLADVKSGDFMKSYKKDRIIGRIVFFDESVPCLYVKRGETYVLVGSDDQIKALEFFDGRCVAAVGKKAGESFILNKLTRFEFENNED